MLEPALKPPVQGELPAAQHLSIELGSIMPVSIAHDPLVGLLSGSVAVAIAEGARPAWSAK